MSEDNWRQVIYQGGYDPARLPGRTERDALPYHDPNVAVNAEQGGNDLRASAPRDFSSSAVPGHGDPGYQDPYYGSWSQPVGPGEALCPPAPGTGTPQLTLPGAPAGQITFGPVPADRGQGAGTHEHAGSGRAHLLRQHRHGKQSGAGARAYLTGRVVGGAAAAIVVITGSVVIAVAVSGGHSVAAGHKPTSPAAARSPSRASPSALSLPSSVTGSLPVFPGSPTRGIGRIADPATGLSWARLAGPWVSGGPVAPGFDLSESFSTGTFTDASGTHQWLAMVASGPLGSDAGAQYLGPASLPQVASAYQANVVMKEFYPNTQARDLGSGSFAVDGHRAWQFSLALYYNIPSLKSTFDTVVVALIDTGRNVPAVFWANVPNDYDQYLPDITAEFRSLQVTP